MAGEREGGITSGTVATRWAVSGAGSNLGVERASTSPAPAARWVAPADAFVAASRLRRQGTTAGEHGL